jgi:hypothetical protein
MQMQYEEKSNLEERIIAHFDGSLDSQSSNTLLDEVMASPEKRALFRAHETLNSVIAAARVPMEAPLEARREIADRIPGLIAFIPGLLGTAETMPILQPILQQSANPFISFFARMSLQTAVSIGSAVAVLTTAGIIVKNNLDNNSAQTPKIAAIQSDAPSNSAPQNYAMAPAVPKAASAGISKHTASNVRTINAGSNAFAAVQPSVPEPTTQDNASSSQSVTPTPEDNAPRVSNAFDSPKPASAIADNIPVAQSHLLTPMLAVVGEGITVRPYLSSSNRFVQLNGISGSATSKFVPGYLGGLEFELGDRWAFRAQGGQSGFAQVTYINTHTSRFGLAIYQPTTIATTGTSWATLGMSYSIGLTEAIPLILSGDAGAAFLQKTGVMGMFGAATEIPISSNITLRPQLTFDVVSTSTQPISTPSGNAIMQNSISTTSMLSQAFGFQINMMFRF